MEDTMADLAKDVQGVAVYAEFTRAGAASQVIIVPEGYDNEGRLIGLSIVRRVVTTDSPKKPWRFAILAAPPNAGDPVANADKDAYCATRMAVPATLFDQLATGGWVMVRQPILLEASKKDMDDIGMKKTPAKLLYRVSQSRTALGFPEALLN
jgi:hypothetical protein